MAADEVGNEKNNSFLNPARNGTVAQAKTSTLGVSANKEERQCDRSRDYSRTGIPSLCQSFWVIGRQRG